MRADVPERRILLVEDNRTDVTLIRLAFAEHGIDHELVVLDDGEKALDYIAKLNGEKLPELMIVDLNLPKRDGIEVIENIRSTPALDRIPIVVFTTSDSPREKESASTIGVTAYIRKPSDLDGFLAVGGTIRQLLEEGAASIGTHP
jgi:two-component system response regulator